VTTTIGEFTNIRKRASELGFGPLESIALLPRGFEADEVPDSLLHDEETATLRKLLAERGVSVQQPCGADGTDSVQVEKSAEWIAPLIFVGSQVLFGAPETVSLLISVIEYFAVRVTRGLHQPNVKLSFVLEVDKERTYKRLSYEGPPQSIKTVEALIKRISDEQNTH